MPAEYYYVTKQTDQTNFHLLHRRGCIKLPTPNSLVFIGSLYNSLQALTVAKFALVKMSKPVTSAVCRIRKKNSADHSSFALSQPATAIPCRIRARG